MSDAPKTKANSQEDSGMDAELSRLLGAERDVGEPMDVTGMLEAVEGQIQQADKATTWWLRSRSTATRRLLSLGSSALLIAVAVGLGLRGDVGDYPVHRLITSVVALGVLLGVSLWFAIRPLHKPPLPRWVHVGLGVAVVGATFAFCAMPESFGQEAPGFFDRASPCMYFGLLFGIPVYALVRMLDRGAEMSALLTACSAGLLANLVLQLHCPVSTPEHLLAGHFSVLVIFLSAIGVIRLWELALRNRGT